MSSNRRVKRPNTEVNTGAQKTAEAFNKEHGYEAKQVRFVQGGSEVLRQARREGFIPEDEDEDVDEELFLPATYHIHDEDDERIFLKKHFARTRELGDVRLEKRDVDWFKRRLAEAEEAMFDKWSTAAVDIRRPEERDMLKKLNPGYFKRIRLRAEANFELARRLFEITLEGVQTEDDVKLLHAIDTGQIRPPPDGFWHAQRVQEGAIPDEDLGDLFSVRSEAWGRGIAGRETAGFPYSSITRNFAGANTHKMGSQVHGSSVLPARFFDGGEFDVAHQQFNEMYRQMAAAPGGDIRGDELYGGVEERFV